MYESYYGLRRLPFENVLDTSFYYPSYGHREALSAVIYAINQKKGLVVVAGHPGTGKSFLIQLVKEQLQETDYVIEIKSRIDLVRGLVERLEEVLSITPDEDFSQYRQDKLAERLEELGDKGGRIILLIDEAQTLNEEEMEYIRLLWNIESKSGKLIQTILFGQKELLDLLRKDEMQATLQRVQVFRVLKGLSLEDTKRYIKTRLNAAGSDEMVFTDDGIELIHTLSRGFLRMINQLCDQGMMSAYVSKKPFVGAEQIKDVIAENPIYMDDYDQEIENTIVATKKVLEIEGNKQKESHRKVAIEEEMEEDSRQEVVSSNKTGNHQRLGGMVVGAVMIGIVWLVVSSIERQEAIEKSSQQTVAKVTAEEIIDHSVTETDQESGPLFTIGELEELTHEDAETNTVAPQEVPITGEPNPVAIKSEKDTDSEIDSESVLPGKIDNSTERQSALDKLEATDKDIKDSPHPVTVVATEDSEAVELEQTKTKVETVVAEDKTAAGDVANFAGKAVVEEEKQITVSQEQVHADTASDDTKERTTINADAQKTKLLESVEKIQEQSSIFAKSNDTNSEQVSAYVGVNQDIPFPFNQSSEVSAEEVKVEEGKSISKLALEKYGAWNWSLEDILTHLNTGIASVDLVYADSSIRLPQLTREQMLVQSAAGKYYIYLKTVDIEKVRSERKAYQEQGAGVRLQEVLLSGHRKIRLYLGPMSDEGLARDWLKIVKYDFAPFALK